MKMFIVLSVALLGWAVATPVRPSTNPYSRPMPVYPSEASSAPPPVERVTSIPLILPESYFAGLNRVTADAGQTFVFHDSRIEPLEKDLQLTPEIQVFTNATFAVNEGTPRVLEDGAILDERGTMILPDGRLWSVFDHFISLAWNVYLFADGSSYRLTRDYGFPDGTRITPDAKVFTPDGRMVRLIEGQMLKLDGEPLPSLDTVTVRGGRVYVQKEGAQFGIPPERSIMMNDGTKVFGSGKLARADDREFYLGEGEIFILPGVVSNLR